MNKQTCPKCGSGDDFTGVVCYKCGYDNMPPGPGGSWSRFPNIDNSDTNPQGIPYPTMERRNDEEQAHPTDPD